MFGISVDTMSIDRKEAQFLADLFDATLKAVEKQRENLPDFITAQAFLGNDVNPDNLPDEVLLDDMATIAHEMLCIRSRIRQRFDI